MSSRVDEFTNMIRFNKILSLLAVAALAATVFAQNSASSTGEQPKGSMMAQSHRHHLNMHHRKRPHYRRPPHHKRPKHKVWRHRGRIVHRRAVIHPITGPGVPHGHMPRVPTNIHPRRTPRMHAPHTPPRPVNPPGMRKPGNRKKSG